MWKSSKIEVKEELIGKGILVYLAKGHTWQLFIRELAINRRKRFHFRYRSPQSFMPNIK